VHAVYSGRFTPRTCFRPLRTLADEDAVTMMKDLAQSARVDELAPVSLHLLGSKLLKVGDSPGAEKLLRIARRRYPGDAWLNQTLAKCLAQRGREKEAIWYLMAARSLSPESSHLLALSLGSGTHR
jgi:Flp pilus assembly protein TadD